MLGLNYSEQRGAFISRADHAGFKPSTSTQAAGSWGGDRCGGGVSSHRARSAEEDRQTYPNTQMLIDGGLVFLCCLLGSPTSNSLSV